jgi:type I restriction enzyme S subunit
MYMEQDLNKVATGSSQKNLLLGTLKNISIPCPPLDEQRKIADILSTWDAAIGLTAQLIAALGRRKQALMQLLLTGEVRFAEFEGSEWEERTLGDVTNRLESGGTPSTQIEEFWTGTIPWITGADFGELKIGVGKIALAPFDVAISQDITRVVPKSEIMITSYLLYYLAYSIAKLAKFNQGTSINGVKREDLKNHVIRLTSLDEQAKIASLLELYDEEIGILQSYLGQITVEKRGLMQQLLTGQVRVST